MTEQDVQYEKNEAEVKRIMELAKANYPGANVDKIWRAFMVAETMHRGQLRQSGEPFIIHPIAVAAMLAEMEMDVNCITAGMLHDVVEDTSMTYDDVQAEFGAEIAKLVDGATKLKRIGDTTKEEQQAENLRKMFLAIAEDMRVIVIKLVDRLHNMRTLQYVNTDKQIKKAQETLDVYTPLAHRFGMAKIKWELEDLCFKYLDPEGYASLAAQLSQKRSEREEYIKSIISTVKTAIEAEGFEAHLDGRPKHLFSIKKKMDRQHKPLDQIYDLLAIRVIVDNVAQCYRVLGIIHQLYTPVPHRFKDYIATPKPNMYQSIHTTVIGHGGVAFEAQIRTWDMHNAAELGIAAHWRYKEGGKEERDENAEKKFEWVRKLFDMQKDMDTTDGFMEAFKMDLFTDEVFVFTPKGDVKSLPAGSTPIDFAYAIHSGVGHKMIGARVNGELKPLDYCLQTGDMVQILTSNSPNRAPSRDWLKMVKSSEARTKLRQWFKNECREENIEVGRDMLDRELKRQGYTYQQLFGDEEIVESFLKRNNLRSIEDLMNIIGFGDMTAQKAVSRLKDLYLKKHAEADAKDDDFINKLIDDKAAKSIEKASADGIIVKGVDNCLVHPARCCNPVPGDAIIGYTTRARGVSVHRRDCPNVIAMNRNEANRMIDVRWARGASSVAPHPAEVVIEAIDTGRMLIAVANIINEMSIRMTSINSKNTRDNYQIIHLVVQITDRSALDKLIDKLGAVDGVINVTRTVK